MDGGQFFDDTLEWIFVTPRDFYGTGGRLSATANHRGSRGPQHLYLSQQGASQSVHRPGVVGIPLGLRES